MHKSWPPGKPSRFQLPLIDDLIQFWELLWHFSEVLGLEEPVPLFNRPKEERPDNDFSSLPYLDLVRNSHATYALASSGSDLIDVTQLPASDYFAGALLITLNLLFSELQEKVDISFDKGEWKLRKRRKLDGNKFCFFNHNLFELLCINELTWPELARRYLLNIPLVENNVDMLGTEDFTVLYCLQGHTGKIDSFFHNGAQLQADSQLLAGAVKKIYGTFGDVNENLKVCSSVVEKLGSMNEAEGPDWVKALEPARKLPTNVGARIRNCVNEALLRNPPEWARKRLEYSISKEVYKGNASGPTKKVILSVLADVSGNSEQRKTSIKMKNELSGTLSDSIIKQCQKVLRIIVSSDVGKKFFSLRGRIRQSILENDEEKEKDVRTLVLCSFDFRIIDIRLECGVYTGSHVAFVEDVREVWSKMRLAYTNQPGLLHLVETLSQDFELLYEKEVLIFVHKLAEMASRDSNIETSKEVELILEDMGKVPIAAWDDGICNICGVDKDDDNVLLCDKCDSGYHTYCLNPPLERIPGGNWYCPSCAGSQSLDKGGLQVPPLCDQSRKRKKQEDDLDKICCAFASLRSKMEVSDVWEFNVEEKILLLKILSDKFLQTSRLQDYLENCSSISDSSHAQLWALSSQWKILNKKGVCIVHCAVPQLDNSSPTFKCHVTKDSVPCIKLQAEKVPMCKDLLGCDSAGRNYWVFSRSGFCPLVVVEDGSTGQQENFQSYPVCGDISASSQLLFYRADTGIQDLIKWLTNNSPSQRMLINQLEHVSSSYNKCLNEARNSPEESLKPVIYSSNYSIPPMTKALHALEGVYGSFDDDCAKSLTETQDVSPIKKLFRCGCLELLWPGRHHCRDCHNSYSITSQFAEHKLKCENVQNGKLNEKDESERRVKTTVPSVNSHAVSSAEFSCPYNLEEICSRFRTKNSNAELVKEIGLLGSDGIPLLFQSSDPCFCDPRLRLTPSDNAVDQDKGASKVVCGSPVLCHGQQKRCMSAFKSGETTDTFLGNSSLKALVGKGKHILRQLQISLLDIDAALPEGSLKLAKSSSEKRCAWRAFVKSAKSVYEMVQATIVLEDSIKADYLKNEWWYWSTLSAVSTIATVSSLALRIYALDASIHYTKPSSSSPEEPFNIVTEPYDASLEIQRKSLDMEDLKSADSHNKQHVSDTSATDSNVSRKPLIKYLKKR